MCYIIVFLLFLIWSIYAIRKGHMTWHTLLSIYFVTLFIVDIGDDTFEFWLDFYDLPVHLLEKLDIGRYLGIILSDGVIFPLVAVVFCYYSVRYHRPWLTSILFAIMLGLIEFVYVKYNCMIYHHWNHLATPLLTFIALRILAYFADRFIYYSPPVSYRFRLLCAVYGIVEWPGAILGGSLRFYQYRLHIFNNETADTRFVAVIFAIILGVIAALLITRVSHKFRLIFFMILGLIYSAFSLFMHSKGLVIYNKWNDLIAVIRYILPFVAVYFYDKWESQYTRTKSVLPE